MPPRMKRNAAGQFIKRAVNKPGALSRQLGIPIEKNIPISLLSKLDKAKIGDRIMNPTKSGKRNFMMNEKLKRRVVLALTLKRFRRS